MMNEINLLEKMRAEIPLRDPAELAATIGFDPKEAGVRPLGRSFWAGPGTAVGRVGVARRVVVMGLAAAGLAAAATVGPALAPDGSSLATSYANSAMEIVKEDGQWVARIKDPFAEHKLYAEAFQAVGLKVDMRLVPVSPSRVASVANINVSGTWEGPDISAGTEPAGCGMGEADCRLAVRVPVGLEAPVTIKVGRPAEPNERYEVVGRATDKGEILEGVEVNNRKVSDVLKGVRERGLRVEYERIRSRPEAGTSKLIVGKDTFNVSFESVSADAVKPDWIVFWATANDQGTVRLTVAPKELEPLPSQTR